MAKKSFGDSSKLSTEKFSNRAKKATVRQDPPQTYAKGGAVRGGGAAMKGVGKGQVC